MEGGREGRKGWDGGRKEGRKGGRDEGKKGGREEKKGRKKEKRKKDSPVTVVWDRCT
jgi:hypothetical protein